MILKQADNKSTQISQLEALLKDPSIPSNVKAEVELDLKKIRAGISGESETAYELDFYFAQSKGIMVIHDLRVEHNGRVAQIDHLFINRLLQVYVCESKRFSEGISINSAGECTSFYKGKPRGIGSPFEQNKKHILVLKDLIKDGIWKFPTRLGFTLNPEFISQIIVSKSARISNASKNPEYQAIVKADQLKSAYDKKLESAGLLKVVSPETLQELATKLVDLHKPLESNWTTKYRKIAESSIVEKPEKTTITREPNLIDPENIDVISNSTNLNIKNDEIAVVETNPEDSKSETKSKLICETCGCTVPFVVAQFCWRNKKRFGGKVYCKEHQ